MKATFKCSNCNAEMTNLNFNWGKKYWLFMIPCAVLIMLPMWQLYKPKENYRQDLQVKVLETREDDAVIEILGIIQNNGKVTWSNIQLDAEFFDPGGKFIDEASDYVSSSVDPGGSEHFKMRIEDADKRLRGDDVRMELKVADAYSRSF